MNTLLKTLLGVGLYLLERSDDATKSARERAAARMDDLRDAAQEKYETATERVRRASRAIRGEDEDNDVLRNTLFLAAGIGVGVGVGLILAPASGDETRSVIADKVHDMGGRVRRQFSSEGATGTAG